MSASSDTLLNLAQARFSCRAFLATPIPQDIITQIVDTARHVPSWCNAQPWQITITKAAETDRFRDALFAYAQSGAAPAPDVPWPESYPGVYGDRRRACGWQLYDAVGIAKGDRAASAQEMFKNFQLFGAPHVALIHAPKALGTHGAMDCGGFVTAFCLAAQAQGVATIAQAALTTFAPFVKNWMNIPADRNLLCAISFGRADMDHPANSFRTPRETADAIIDWKD